MKESLPNCCYVYRFVDEEDDVIYVGRTTNLYIRMNSHEKLSDKVKRIDVLPCKDQLVMCIKELFYISYYANEKTLNNKDILYQEEMTDEYISSFMNIANDIWYCYAEYDDTYNKLLMKNMCNSINRAGNIATYMNNNLDQNIIYGIINQNSHLINTLNPNNVYILDEKKNVKLYNPYKERNALSYNWFANSYNNDKVNIKKIHNDCKNMSNNIMKNKYNKKTNSNNVIWTTYHVFAPYVKDKGYSKGYIDVLNTYNIQYEEDKEITKNRFLCMIALNIILSNKYKNIMFYNTVTDLSNSFSLIIMLIMFNKTRLRYNEPIYVYVPSKRMRDILDEWSLSRTGLLLKRL